MANSRTGASTSPWGEGRAGDAEEEGLEEEEEEEEEVAEVSLLARACNSGNKKAQVFPLPVFATDTTSRPERMMGQAQAWTGVGAVYEVVNTCVMVSPKGVDANDWKGTMGTWTPVTVMWCSVQ